MVRVSTHNTPSEDPQEQSNEKTREKRICEQIWELKKRGLKATDIAKVLDCSRQTVYYHLRKTKEEAFEEATTNDQSIAIGEMLRFYDDMIQEAVAQLYQTEVGSYHRYNYIECASRRHREKVEFMTKMGLIHPVAKFEEIDEKQLDRMTPEEIRQKIADIQEQIADTELRAPKRKRDNG